MIRDSSAIGYQSGVIIQAVGITQEDSIEVGRAGGFAGSLQGVIIGTKNGSENGGTVHGIREVIAGEHTGGFVGLADLARILNTEVTHVKQISSSKTAGGTSFQYLANIQLDSALFDYLLKPLLDTLLQQLLHIGDLEEGNIIKINLGIIELDVLYDGKLLSLNLLGLKISASLVDGDDVLNVSIEDSVIQIPYDKNTGDIQWEQVDLNIALIKANRTKIAKSRIQGIANEYDVYTGGASNKEDVIAATNQGRAGGFVGYNNEGLLEENQIYYCDVIKGNVDEIAPFVGVSSLDTNYPNINNIDTIEGNQNIYRIYRNAEGTYSAIKKGSQTLNDEETSNTLPLTAYESSSKAVLMNDVVTQMSHQRHQNHRIYKIRVMKPYILQLTKFGKTWGIFFVQGQRALRFLCGEVI